jgi:predicted TIM-barrel fold metal-dependent hydrolase
MKAVRELEHYVRDHGFVALRIEPFLWRKPPTDRAYYPLYAKAAELGVTFQTQVGHTGPLYPSETGRPTYIDEVALDFPELRIVCGHIGWPWTQEMIAVAWKHKNVWIDTSAHVPKHYPPEFVHFMKTFGKDKVCFATDYPLLQWSRVLAEVEGLGLPDDVKRRFLHDNAVRAFNLQV